MVTPTANAAELLQRSATRIELWPIVRLKPYERNARIHTPQQVEELALGIRRYGYLVPIIAGRGDVVLAGHAGLKAARLVGLDPVPVIPIGHLDDDEQRAFIIFHNRIAERSGWDHRLLPLELKAIVDLKLPELPPLGFSGAELDGILARLKDDAPAREVGFKAKPPAAREYVVRVLCATPAEQRETHERLTAGGYRCAPIEGGAGTT